jgi:hypothetical protein
MLTMQGGVAVFQTNDKDVAIMLEERKTRQTTDPVHLGFNEQRQPLLRGDAYHYLIARGDQLAFAAEVVRFGFSPSDFALEIQRVPNKSSRHPLAVIFEVTVENVPNRRRASYPGGPGRAWIAGFLEDLIAGAFGQP